MDFMRNHKPMVIGIILLFIALIALSFMNSSDTEPQVNQGENSDAVQVEQVMESNELVIDDVVVGEGAEAVNGKNVTVHYTGTFEDGKVFDSSVERGQPFTFFLGAGQVIKGWDQGVLGMKVGGKRKLTIPSDLAYGPNDYGPIPGGSTLHFEVELLGVE